MASRKQERTIYFPWEQRRGLLQAPWLRSRPLMAAVGMMALLTLLASRERDRTGTRSTRATLLVVRQAVDAYRADHDGRCPTSLALLEQERYLSVPARDAWGRHLELTCPGRRNPESYDLVSFGPSGTSRGLDRIE